MKKRKSKKQKDIAKFDSELKLITPKIKQLNDDIQNCYKIKKMSEEEIQTFVETVKNHNSKLPDDFDLHTYQPHAML